MDAIIPLSEKTNIEPQQKSCSIFWFCNGAKLHIRLEREEKEAVADEYGEFFELDDATQQSHRAFAFNLAPPSSSTGNAGTGSLTRGQEAASAELEGLYKIIVRKIEMPILCSRRFIDFEGR